MSGERGAALLITLVLITVIGSIAFGVGRSTLTNFRLVTRLEDSLNAYQAAQAGIEDGLLRFRFDKNAEVPTNCPDAPKPTTNTSYYARVSLLGSGLPNCADLSATPFVAPSTSEIVYDLKMHFRKDPGQSECIVTAPAAQADKDRGCTELVGAALARDTSVEYAVEGINNLQVLARFESVADPQRKLEIIFIDTGDVVRQELYDPIGDQITTLVPLGINIKKIRIRPFGKNLVSYELTPPPGISLDSRITTVESVGYFGVSKRKLKLTLDRVSGTVFEVFDFVLFAGGVNSDIIGPNP